MQVDFKAGQYVNLAYEKINLDRAVDLKRVRTGPDPRLNGRIIGRAVLFGTPEPRFRDPRLFQHTEDGFFTPIPYTKRRPHTTPNTSRTSTSTTSGGGGGFGGSGGGGFGSSGGGFRGAFGSGGSRGSTRHGNNGARNSCGDFKMLGRVSRTLTRLNSAPSFSDNYFTDGDLLNGGATSGLGATIGGGQGEGGAGRGSFGSMGLGKDICQEMRSMGLFVLGGEREGRKGLGVGGPLVIADLPWSSQEENWRSGNVIEFPKVEGINCCNCKLDARFHEPSPLPPQLKAPSLRAPSLRNASFF